MTAAASPLVAAACGCAWLALFAWLSRRQGQSLPTSRAWGGLIGVAALAIFVIAGYLTLQLPGVPYNILELMDRYATFALMAIVSILMAAGGLPVALAAFWKRRRTTFALLFIPIVVASGSIVFFVLWTMVPLDSVDDLVGSPVMGIGPVLERWLRYVALCAGPLAGMTIGARIALGGLRPRAAAIGFVVTAAVLSISWIVVVRFAGTSNVVELLRGYRFNSRNYGDALGATGVVSYLVLLGAVITMAARSASGQLGRRSLPVAGSVLMLLLSIPIGWQLLVLATNPRVEKYDRVFSARQFLLSADREHYLDDRQLFTRFAILQLGMSFIFAAGAASALLMAGDDSGETIRRPPRRARA